MEKIFIICLEDQREVLDAVAKDLEELDGPFQIEECEAADEAEDLLEEIDAEGGYVGVIVSDHVMPGKSGVDFLIEIHQDGRFRSTKKLLLTGLATYQDTINAINNAAINRFIEKPWEKEQLVEYVKILMTEYILDKGFNYEPFLPYLHKSTLYNELKKNV